MDTETNSEEKKPDEQSDFKSLNTFQKVIFCLVVFVKAFMSWRVALGIFFIFVFISSMGEHTVLGSSHEDAYQGGRFIWLMVGAVLTGTGIGNNIKKMRSQ